MFFPSFTQQKSLKYLSLFCQGSSKANVHMEWDKIWALNKKVCRQGKCFVEFFVSFATCFPLLEFYKIISLPSKISDLCNI